MIGISINKINNWINNFVTNTTVQNDQADIDYFCKNLNGKRLLEVAFNIYDIIVEERDKNCHNFAVLLDVSLRHTKYKKKAPHNFIKRRHLNKLIPPGISVFKKDIHKIIEENGLEPLPSYNKHYKKYKCYYSCKQDGEFYDRFIVFIEH